MARVVLRIEPEFLGPFSVGTIEHIQVLCRELGLGLAPAKELIDRCVFGSETVAIDVDSDDVAQRIADSLARIAGPAKVTVRIER